MGIFGALTTAVTGLRAQSFALENISGNIANSQTTAFKRVDTSFLDLIPDNPPAKQLAGTVAASARATNTVQGDFQAASIGTFMAINGDGFFVVQKPSSFTDGRPTFDGSDLYTRRGDFQTNKDGYLVNGAGYYLMGIPVDAKTGNLAGSVPQLLKFQNDFLPAQPTTQVQYRANLAAYPATTAHDTSVPGSELIDPEDVLGQSDRRLASARADHRLRRRAVRRCQRVADRHAGRAGGDDHHRRVHDQRAGRRHHERHDSGAGAGRDQFADCGERHWRLRRGGRHRWRRTCGDYGGGGGPQRRRAGHGQHDRRDR